MPEFVLTGLAGTELTGLVWNDAMWVESALYATSSEGFYRFDDGQWQSFVEVGAQGREVTAVRLDPGNENRFITGRLDEMDHGYLELTSGAGQANEIVHTSASGRVVKIELDSHYFNYEPWAILRAGDQPGVASN